MVSRRPVLVMLMAGLFLNACAAEVIKGSGNVTSEARDVSGFNEVELKGVGNLTVRQTGSESLTIEAEDNILPYLRTEVENNRLTIYIGDYTAIRPTEPISYNLSVKDLDALNLLGSGDIDAANISTEALTLNLSGSGNMDAARISAGKLELALQGSGDVKAAGEVDTQVVHISGSGSYRAENLQSKEAKIDLGGSGAAILSVSDELDVRLKGSGSVEYRGNATLRQDITGSGRVTEL